MNFGQQLLLKTNNFLLFGLLNNINMIPFPLLLITFFQIEKEHFEDLCAETYKFIRNITTFLGKNADLFLYILYLNMIRFSENFKVVLITRIRILSNISVGEPEPGAETFYRVPETVKKI